MSWSPVSIVPASNCWIEVLATAAKRPSWFLEHELDRVTNV